MYLQLTYAAAEDRLLLRIDFGDRVAGYWLTRRVVSLLWPILWERVQSGLAGGAGAEARPWLASLQHDQLRDRQAIEQRPPFVPTTPVRLVTTLKHGPGGNGAHRIGLFDTDGQGEMLSLDDESLHGLIRLLQASVQTANWNLDLRQPALPALAAGSELRH